MSSKLDHGVMDAVHAVWNDYRKNQGGTMETLGLAMGYGPKCAKQAVNQFLKSADPRISMLYKFSDATGFPITHFVGEK